MTNRKTPEQDLRSAYQAVVEHRSVLRAAEKLGLPDHVVKYRYHKYLLAHPDLPPVKMDLSRPSARISPEQIQRAIALLEEHGGNSAAAARAAGLSRSTFQGQIAAGERQRDEVTPLIKGNVKALQRQTWKLPRKGEVFRYIFTCAQNNTRLHEGTWASIIALAEHYGAEIHVSRFTYDLSSYGVRNTKPGRDKSEGQDEIWYDPRIENHVLDESVQVAPGLIFCGEMNILPTAARPLSGFQAYTGRSSGIFPHVKFAMESVPSGKFEGTKLNFTTGTITQRNYIQKTAGLKAEFHHGYGAVLVEVDSDGDWFVRQLNADSEGVIYDLTLRAADGKVTDGHRVEAVNWGDIHVGRVSRDTERLLWNGDGSMGAVLRPKQQFMHDVIDFRARNHHEMKNFHRMLDKFYRGKDDVVAELRDVNDFLRARSKLKDCLSVVVRSNHDAALDRWLREADYKADLKNAKFFLQAQLAMVEAIEANDKRFLASEWAINHVAEPAGAHVLFLRQDDSFIICPDANGGIECGHHGDKGANGSRGALNQFARTGRKTNTGDSHSPGIIDGAYRAGVTGDLDHGYNEGMSSWSNTHIVTYANGKRALVTCWNGKWRAR